MTHYWWMHWFWITFSISLTFCKTSTPVHSNVTVLPHIKGLNVSDTVNQTSKPHEGGLNRPPTISPSNATKTTLTKTFLLPKDITFPKSDKNFQKKVEFFFSNVTSKNKTITENSKDKEKEKVKESVINISENVTEKQVLVNTSLLCTNRTDNVTYLEADVSFNQSSIQNSERLGVKNIEEDVNIPENNLSAAGITGITLGCIIVVGVLSGLSYFIYRNRGFNRPQVLNDRCSNPDSSGYIDDASVRDNSEEMYSLDNDSFLNSLEAMTIQNYWTDTVKHTKL